VIFDLDGTLVDSVPIYFQIMEEMLAAVGLPPASRPLVVAFMNRGPAALEKMVPPEQAHCRAELVRECLAVGRRLAGERFRSAVPLFPGVPRLFALLTGQGIPLGVVTSTQRSHLERKMRPLERAGLREALAAVVAIEDAPRQKPAPDPLLLCTRKLAVDPARCLFVGDARTDLQAGRAAGMFTAGVLSGLDDRETLLKEHPALLLDSVADLCDWVNLWR
jgi:phosphoglycolate phosphatase-like HAD superfamily hydrolase